MNFNDFCENEKDFNNNENDNRFEKINNNLHKNAQKTQQNQQNFNNFDNFSKNNGINTGGEYTKKQNFDETEIAKKIEKYQNMSQSELLSELLKESSKQKQNGNLDDKKLEEIKNSLSGVLTKEQQTKLDDLIKMLR